MIKEIIKTKLKNYDSVLNIAKVVYTPIRKIRQHIENDALAINVITEIENSVAEKKIFYMGVPAHDNLGDLAQTYCTRKWIAENYPDYLCVEIGTNAAISRKLVSYLNKTISEHDFFIFQSGYCTQNLHLDHFMHKLIVRNFPTSRIVFFPQTVNISTEKEKKITRKAFSKGQRLLFLSRDSISTIKAQDFLPNEKVIEYPDIVTSLIGGYHYDSKRDGVLLCVRNDSEKLYSVKEIESLRIKLLEVFSRADQTDTNSGYSYEYTVGHLQEVLEKKFMNFSEYEVIITDRYHGTIFSLIANTPVIVLKTTDHKVKTGVDWFTNIMEPNAVQYVETIEEAFELARAIHDESVNVNNRPYFKSEFYEALKEKIEKI